MIRRYFKWSVGAFALIGTVNRGHAFVRESIANKYGRYGYTCSYPQFGDGTLNIYVSYLEGPDGQEDQISKIIAEYGTELTMGEAVALVRKTNPPGTHDGVDYGYAYIKDGIITRDTTNTTDSMTVYEGIPVTEAGDVDRATGDKIQDTVKSSTNGVDGMQDQMKLMREVVVALTVKAGYKTEVECEMTVAEADAILTNAVTINQSINAIRNAGKTAKTSAGV